MLNCGIKKHNVSSHCVTDGYISTLTILLWVLLFHTVLLITSAALAPYDKGKSCSTRTFKT